MRTSDVTSAPSTADPTSVAALVTNVGREFRTIDVLHYNAASMRKATLAEQPLGTFNSDLTVNIVARTQPHLAHARLVLSTLMLSVLLI